MATYAQIETGTVVNIILADAGVITGLPGTYAEVPSDVPVGLGWLYDGTDFTDPTPAAGKRLRLSVREFREQFTQAEKQALYTAAKSNVDLEIYLDDLRAVEYVDLDFPQTIAGVQVLEVAGLIGPGRAAEILEGI